MFYLLSLAIIASVAFIVAIPLYWLGYKIFCKIDDFQEWCGKKQFYLYNFKTLNFLFGSVGLLLAFFAYIFVSFLIKVCIDLSVVLCNFVQEKWYCYDYFYVYMDFRLVVMAYFLGLIAGAFMVDKKIKGSKGPDSID